MSEVAKSIFIKSGQSSHSTDGAGQLRGQGPGNVASLEETKDDGASPPKKEQALTQLEVKSLENEGQSQPRATPTKSGSTIRPDRTTHPNLPILGRDVRLVVLPPDCYGIEPHDEPRQGSLAEVVRQTEKAEIFCKTHRAEVGSKWMVHPLPPSHID